MAEKKANSIILRALGLLGLSAAVNRQARLVGLDLGAHHLRAVGLTCDNDGLVVSGFMSGEIDPSLPRVEAIRRLLANTELAGCPVATAVSGQAVIVRYILLPEMSADRLAEAVQNEAPKYIPFDMADIMLDFQRLGKRQHADGASETRVVLVAAKKNFIYEHLELIQSAGLSLKAVDVDCFAIANAFEHYCQRHPEVNDAAMKSGASVALLDVGDEKTEINILEKGKLAFTREAYVSQADFTREIARRLGVEPEAAEKLKREPGELAEKVAQCVGRVLEELVRETRLSFDYFEHQNDQTVERVYLSGGGSRLPTLRDGFEEKMGKPVILWDPVDGLTVDETKVDLEQLKACGAELSVAVGLATRVL